MQPSSQPYPEHPVSYRQEVVAPLFKYLRAGESCLVVGAASMGKGNLLRFIQRVDVLQHYLGSGWQQTLLVPVDLNRRSEDADWAFYELVLHALVAKCRLREVDPKVIAELVELHRDVALSGNRLLGQRYLERAAQALCQLRGYRLVFLIDEADAFYSTASPQLLDNLRAVRDEHKYRLAYVLFTRTLLERLRPPRDGEAFYELFNRNTLGLPPFGPEDTGRVIAQLEARKETGLDDAQRAWLAQAGGGHSGLLIVLFDALASGRLASGAPPGDCLALPPVREECQKLLDGLDELEQVGLIRALAGQFDPAAAPDDALLALKGLVQPGPAGGWRFFSPLFERFAAASGTALADFTLDEDSATIWVGGRPVSDLSKLEFDLARLLYQRRGEVVKRDDILLALYPQEFEKGQLPDLQDNRVDTLIKRLRKKVEPVPEQPRFILTKRGHGYLLAGEADDKGR